MSVTVAVAANNVVALRDLLLAGAGFGLLPLHVVREELAAGRLRQACPGWSSRKLTLHALLPTRRAPPRVRLFLDRLATAATNLGSIRREGCMMAQHGGKSSDASDSRRRSGTMSER
ncbi:hypothetical protein AKJ09_04621 [Labilithrix luteola]|uniref:LysR substrate-binding domain-containing protein n=1 Tax=Labilithrix luteola TaxID=1391654 RepID=A0A0K1PWR5_9BACT|nr:hypothetical protein AKJ09_04621 [Labilithrix luteola]